MGKARTLSAQQPAGLCMMPQVFTPINLSGHFQNHPPIAPSGEIDPRKSWHNVQVIN